MGGGGGGFVLIGAYITRPVHNEVILVTSSSYYQARVFTLRSSTHITGRPQEELDHKPAGIEGEEEEASVGEARSAAHRPQSPVIWPRDSTGTPTALQNMAGQLGNRGMQSRCHVLNAREPPGKGTASSRHSDPLPFPDLRVRRGHQTHLSSKAKLIYLHSPVTRGRGVREGRCGEGRITVVNKKTFA